jgi:hypothetical protein
MVNLQVRSQIGLDNMNAILLYYLSYLLFNFELIQKLCLKYN